MAMVSTPLAFAPWRASQDREHWASDAEARKGAVDTRMLSFTVFTAVTVPTLTVGSGTGAIIPGSAEIR